VEASPKQRKHLLSSSILQSFLDNDDQGHLSDSLLNSPIQILSSCMFPR
jgi:hypothetical protein